MLPLVEELIPAPYPWDVARKLSHLPHLLFLDSAERHTERGRYSYVMADPTEIDTNLTRFYLTMNLLERIRGPHVDLFSHYSFRKFQSFQMQSIPDMPPFQGGYAGLFGYDLVHELEDIPPNRDYDLATLENSVGVYDCVFSFDHLTQRAWLLSSGYPETDRESRRRLARKRLKRFSSLLHDKEGPVAKVVQTTMGTPITQHHIDLTNAVTSNFTREEYLAAVQKCIDYIHAGDIFQVNLSQRLLAPLTEHPLELYGRLRKLNPAPFACYFDAGDFQIVSASPERFLQVTTDHEIITKPIKGTRPRGKTPAEDAALIADLLTNPKDRAENVMIVDLLRNDIGKVAEYGSVTVPKVCELETYPYVHHLVSEVRGKLRGDKTPFDLLKAAFPGGSVTGAPKVRAMEIIAELEPTARGPYCGSVGFIGFDGVMDTNILIRTFTAAQGWLQFPVGGGIIADSDPESEYQETLDKAAGLLRALQQTP